MTIFHGTFLDVPESPFTGGTLRTAGALLVRDGVVAGRGTLGMLRDSHPDEQVVDLSAGLVLPGFVDTHVHFPQVRMIGALGMPLLDWLERSALPEEARLADVDYARGVARDFLTGLVRSSEPTIRPRSMSCSRKPRSGASVSPLGWWSATGYSAMTC
jgi:guanine deaminase